MMFTGDAEKDIENTLVKKYGDELKSLVLKSPHHGSTTSSTEQFLKAVNPEVALISLGAGNEYGHPHKEILARYKKLGIKVYRTDEDGSIKIISNGTKDYQIDTTK